MTRFPVPSARPSGLLRRLALCALLGLAAAGPAHAQGAPASAAPAAAAPSGAAAAPPPAPVQALVPAPQAAAPASRPVEGPSFAPMGLALLLVLGLMAGTVWVLRRSGLAPQGGANRLLRVVSQLSVGPRDRVLVVEAGERWLLLGVSAAGITRLGTLPKGEAAAPPPAAAAFGTLLEKLRKGRPA
jgi:flagellar protein FliO/FliZ